MTTQPKLINTVNRIRFYSDNMKFKFQLFIIIFALTNIANAQSSFNFVTMQWPYQTQSDGTGLYFEIIKSVYDPAGIKIKYDFLPFKRAKFMVEQNRSDAIVCGYKSPSEPGTYKYLFPKWHIDIDQVYVIFKKNTIKGWKGKASFTGKRIGWQRGYDYFKNIMSDPIELTEFDDMTNGLRMLQADRYDFIFGYINHFKISSKEITGFDINDYQIEPISQGKKLYIKFSNTEHSQKLINIFDDRMDQLYKSGELKKTYSKWGATLVPR